MPKVSVIISTHNRANFICQAVECVLGQTFKDIEIIVVDDGSTDNTREALLKYASAILYIYQENKGRAEARNAGVRLAKGEYIAFLDDDDIWLADKLAKQAAYLDTRGDIGLVHTFSEIIDENGHLLPRETKKRAKLYKKSIKIGYAYEGMIKLGIMFTSSVMLRKKCFDRVGLFDRAIVAFEDWDLYLRVALYYGIGIIKEPLVKYRAHSNQTLKKEFISGRINTSLKHLALLGSYNYNSTAKRRIARNFYIHLAKAYYMDGDYVLCRQYILKTLRINPFLLFSEGWLLIHLLATLLPPVLLTAIRFLKNVF